ncbi:MAG: EF-P lysine aminoacylase EpmA [Planctomycetaceae bacterium]
MMSDSDWPPTATLTVLRHRARLLATVRQFFTEQGYWEVETPLLSRDTCVDTWIAPVAVPHPTQPERTLYLQTSPEFALKRLLAAGADAVFELTRSFRCGESGPRHNLEFTIVEWYRVGDTHYEQMTVVEQLVRTIAAESLGTATGPRIPPHPFPRIRYDEAATSALGASVLELSAAELRTMAESAGIAIPASLALEDRDGWLNLLLAERIEPWLAQFPACFLYDYPASQAALAKVRPGSPDVAERFELYLGGMELCNGYHELTDADELLQRMQRHNAARIRHGAASLPTDSRLIAAMRHGLPPCAGVALGFDRLVQWRLGLTDLQQTLTFPFDRA